MEPPCDACAEYRRGERENISAYGFAVHVCERKREGQWGLESCPCGCAKREANAIEKDKLIYGNAFLGPRGERIDPATVRAAG